MRSTAQPRKGGDGQPDRAGTNYENARAECKISFVHCVETHRERLHHCADLIGYALGQGDDSRSIDLDVLSVCARRIECQTRDLVAGAEDAATLPAHGTMPASIDGNGRRTRALLDAFEAGLNNLSREFMAENGARSLKEHSGIRRVKIRSAHTACLDAKDDLAGGRHGIGDCFDREGLAKAVEDRSFHLFLPAILLYKIVLRFTFEIA
jgi:hypothetical protein